MGTTLLFGVIVAYAVRNVPRILNESKWIAFAIYNGFVIGVILGIVSNFVVKDPDAIFVIESVQVIIIQFGAICLIFIPKLAVIHKSEGLVNLNTNGMKTLTSSPKSQFMISQQPKLSI
jgi:hypothetical protein